MERILELLRVEGGVLARSEHRSIARRLDYCLKLGMLHAILPGVYTAPDPSWEVLIRAAHAFRPGCVLTGAAAARLTWWPECPITVVDGCVPHPVQGHYRRFRWEQRTVPYDLVEDHHGLRLASPALSVLDLVPYVGGQAIDEALRRRAVSLPDLWRALRLTPGRRNNSLRRELLHDSRDEPWSEAERDSHRLLRSVGLSGWRTNYPITVGDVTYWVDIAFPADRVVIEIDGWRFHNSRTSFEKDRWRYSRLAAAGWTVLALPAVAVSDDPEGVLDVIQMALARARRA